MPDTLYLDTARLGQMSKTAQLASFDFARFAGEEAGSMYFDEFLRCGSAVWPDRLHRRYPALSLWQGVEALKDRLKHAAGARPDSKVLLANRSATLMHFAARLLFGPCKNVLITDLTWPSYEAILRRSLGHKRRAITQVELRRDILTRRAPLDFVVAKTVDCFRRHNCDGLFVPVVDNFGIRFPLDEVVREIRSTSELRFVVVDGAQAFCHVPARLGTDICDFYIAGCHKWLRAFHPMGLGFYGRLRSEEYIERQLSRLLARGEIDDPLLSFTRELEGGEGTPFGETVNIAPLFSCLGALQDLQPRSNESSHRIRRENVSTAAGLAQESGWNSLLPVGGLRSGILLVQAMDSRFREQRPHAIRSELLHRGVAVSTYEGGIVRLSMPDTRLRPVEYERLSSALTAPVRCSNPASRSLSASGMVEPVQSTELVENDK